MFYIDSEGKVPSSTSLAYPFLEIFLLKDVSARFFKVVAANKLVVELSCPHVF